MSSPEWVTPLPGERSRYGDAEAEATRPHRCELRRSNGGIHTGALHEWRDRRSDCNGVCECACSARSHGSIPSDFAVGLSDEIIRHMLAFAALGCSGKRSSGH